MSYGMKHFHCTASGHVTLLVMLVIKLLLLQQTEGGVMRWIAVKDAACGHHPGICYSCSRGRLSSEVVMCVHHSSYRAPCSQPGQHCRVVAPCKVTCEGEDDSKVLPPQGPPPKLPPPPVFTISPPLTNNTKVAPCCMSQTGGCQMCDPHTPSVLFVCQTSQHVGGGFHQVVPRGIQCPAGQICSPGIEDCKASCQVNAGVFPPPARLREGTSSTPSPLVAMRVTTIRPRHNVTVDIPPGLDCRDRHGCHLCHQGDPHLYICTWSSGKNGAIMLQPRLQECPVGTTCSSGTEQCTASCTGIDSPVIAGVHHLHPDHSSLRKEIRATPSEL